MTNFDSLSGRFPELKAVEEIEDIENYISDFIKSLENDFSSLCSSEADQNRNMAGFLTFENGQTTRETNVVLRQIEDAEFGDNVALFYLQPVKQKDVESSKGGITHVDYKLNQMIIKKRENHPHLLMKPQLSS